MIADSSRSSERTNTEHQGLHEGYRHKGYVRGDTPVWADRDGRHLLWKMTPFVAREQATLIRQEYPTSDLAHKDADDLEWWADELEGKHVCEACGQVVP